MTWRAAEFREYFLNRIGKESSANTYASILRKLDQFIPEGLDEKIAEVGSEALLSWASSQTSGPFEDYPSNVRSALKGYLRFHLDTVSPDPVGVIIEETSIDEVKDEIEATLFRYERELQVAMRRQLGSLDGGLEAIDDGKEKPVATGKIDIFAQDKSGELVVIELKAGTCPAGAMEQALGYTADIEAETGRPCRTILVAADFPERIRSAARRVNKIKLISYKLQLTFTPET